jgi:hypothetical protein
VRHLAWLHAAPTPGTPRGAAGRGAQDAPPPITRLQRLLNDGAVAVEMPPVPDACGYLVDHLFEVGPAMPGGMGAAPISWQELQAWQHQCGVPLLPWEASLLRRLSQAYLNEHQAASVEDRPAPWAPEQVPVDTRDAVARRISAGMRGFMAAQQVSTQAKSPRK